MELVIIMKEVTEMFKLIKYEYRKDLPLYIIILSVIVALAGYLAISIIAKSNINIGISTILYMLGGWGAVMFIMVIGVISYAREINSRTSYMSFMAPVTTFEIVGAKYISFMITTVVATSIYVAFAYMNITLALSQFEEIHDMAELIDYILVYYETDLIEIFATFAGILFTIWLTILLTVNYAYLAITLSSTILANKRGKAWLAIGLFVGIRMVTSMIEYFIPKFEFGTSFTEILLSNWLVYAFELMIIIGTYFGISMMLKKRVSL